MEKSRRAKFIYRKIWKFKKVVKSQAFFFFIFIQVRRTLASSIHELGVILGQEAVVSDLIPIFNGFLKDLDEVRIGLLKHLSDFLKLLPLDLRRDYLPKMSDFLYMDNDRNWRFRQELAVQMGQLVPLYTAEEVKTHLAPIAVILIRDKVWISVFFFFFNFLKNCCNTWW